MQCHTGGLRKNPECGGDRCCYSFKAPSVLGWLSQPPRAWRQVTGEVSGREQWLVWGSYHRGGHVFLHQWFFNYSVISHITVLHSHSITLYTEGDEWGCREESKEWLRPQYELDKITMCFWLCTCNSLKGVFGSFLFPLVTNLRNGQLCFHFIDVETEAQSC